MAVSRINEAGLNINQYGNRNLIINGAMQVAQRGSLTSVATNTNTYTSCDRFQLSGDNGTGVFSTSQSTDTPNGFGSSLKLDVTTADTSIASNVGVRILTRIEGQDLQRIKKGTSDAQPLTMSFSVKSPKTGVHCLELLDLDNNRSVSKSYTVSSANTWQNFSITFPADTTGAFDNDNAQSLLPIWWLAAGSDYSSGTLQTTWGSRVEANRAVGQVNVLDDTSNDFYITGVQLEVGTEATPFEHRSFGQELSLCQRYYFRLDGGSADSLGFQGEMYSSTNVQIFGRFPKMRAAPTPELSTYAGASTLGGSISSLSSPNFSALTTDSFRLSATSSLSISAGTFMFLRVQASQTGYIDFDAEL